MLVKSRKLSSENPVFELGLAPADRAERAQQADPESSQIGSPESRLRALPNGTPPERLFTPRA